MGESFTIGGGNVLTQMMAPKPPFATKDNNSSLDFINLLMLQNVGL